MKTGMNLLLWTGATTEEHLGLCNDLKAWGFYGVELPMFDPAGSPWSKLASELDDLELARTTVTVLPEGANLIGEETGERKSAVEHLKRCIDASHEVGSEILCGPLYSPVGRLIGRGPNQAEWDRAVAGFQEAGEYAQGSNLVLSIEPLNRFETYFLNCQADASKLVDAVGVNTVQQMYDTFHANIEEKDIGASIRTGGERINHVHISANDRATPGEDHIRWDETFSTLKEIGYDSWLMIEAFGSWLPELAGATCIWREMAPSPEHVAKNGLKFIEENWRR